MTTQVDVIKAAQSLLGQHENPPGSNNTKFGAELGLTPAQWCAQFVSHVLRQAGYHFPADTQHPKMGFSSVGFFQNWARSHGYLTNSPSPGDFACFEWEHDSWPDHIGLVISGVDGSGHFQTIEGNAKGPDGYDEVAYHTRIVSEVSSFIHLPLDHSNEPVGVQVPPAKPRAISPYPKLTNGVLLGRNLPQHPDFTAIYQRQMKKRGWNIGTSGPKHDGVDGIFGPTMERVTKAFEKDKNLPNCKDAHGNWDGITGQVVYKAAFESPVT